MLYKFLAANRQELAQRCQTKVDARAAPQALPAPQAFGVPLLLEELIATLQSEQTSSSAQPTRVPAEMSAAAKKHGKELLRQGFTVDQVVHDYGDLCQAITELAAKVGAPISVDEFHTFNRCLDSAIADAVTEFGLQRDRTIAQTEVQDMNERLGFLSHELRNSLNTAMLAFEAISVGGVAVNGATGAVVNRSLLSMRNIIDRSLADVRLTAGLEAQYERISLSELVEDLRVAAMMEAKNRALTLEISVQPGLVVDADRQMLSSAVSNLLQNAFKFTRAKTTVSLIIHSELERVAIEVKDECGGLPQGRTESLFHSFEQRSADRSGLGLGLSIGRRAVEACGGKLHVRNVVGSGCIFTIELPRVPPARPS